MLLGWSEFGRRVQQNQNGTDHGTAGLGFCVGRGVKGGFHYGATDDFGYKSVEDVVRVYDLHATLLHALGLDHQKLTYPHEGRADSLTDTVVSGAKVIPELLA